MKIGILGAGFTGLSAGLRLLQQGHLVTIFDREEEVGGLAAGFKLPGWDWTLEKAYHHWFVSDDSVLKLASDLNYPVIIKRPLTDVYINGQILPFDSPSSLLAFPYFTISDKLRTSASLAFLKLINNYHLFDHHLALPWIRQAMGKTPASLIWDPLFTAKFGRYKNDVALTWFWARIKKRTASLAYPEGGFKQFADTIKSKMVSMGATFLLNTEVTSLTSKPNQVSIKTKKKTYSFDKAIVTLPSPVFVKIAKGLTKNYIENVSKVEYLHAQNLILVLKKPFMKGYWLNITDPSFPFLVLSEQTNFMDPSHYNNQHILYIGNYLPPNHPYLKMSAQELLKVFDPYLKKINPNYHLQTTTYKLFFSPFAQPIVDLSYLSHLPAPISGPRAFQSPLENVYIANLSMVYPWDRGTNYAIEMGEKVAEVSTRPS